jgi:peroxiredoxin
VLKAGDTLPDVRVQGAPGENIALAGLVADGPVLLVFYLFDWSST